MIQIIFIKLQRAGYEVVNPQEGLEPASHAELVGMLYASNGFHAEMNVGSARALCTVLCGSTTGMCLVGLHG